MFLLKNVLPTLTKEIKKSLLKKAPEFVEIIDHLQISGRCPCVEISSQPNIRKILLKYFPNEDDT